MVDSARLRSLFTKRSNEVLDVLSGGERKEKWEAVLWARNLSQLSETEPTKTLSFRFSPEARLGNHLFEVSTLLGISKTLKRVPVFYVTSKLEEKMLRETNETAPGLIAQITVVHGPVPSNARATVFNPVCCDFQDPRVLLSIEDEHLHINGYYYQSYKYFPNMRSAMLKYLKNSTQKFENLPKSNESSSITCIHVRRGDFFQNNFAASDSDFIRKAKKFLEDKEKAGNSKKYTVLFGDDEKFMKGLFNESSSKNEIFISKNSPSDDLIYSKFNCNTVFLSAPHSTFGWWMGYFSKSNRVYYTDIRMTNDKLYISGNFHEPDYYLPHWTALRYSDDRNAVIESSRQI